MLGALAVPVPAVAAPPAARLASGDNHNCVLRAGTVSCWDTARPYLVPVDLGGVAAVSIVAAGDRTCALSTVGDAYCWDGEDAPRLTAGGVSAMALGTGFTCALAQGVSCWPDNGQPVTVDLPGTVTQLVAGGGTACALASGSVSCWAGPDGQPAAVDLGGASPSEIAVGGDGACALSTVGTAYCWTVSAAVGAPVPGHFAHIARGTDHTCAVTSTGRVYCWHEGTAPARVDLGTLRAAEVRVGAHHACALSTRDALSCWSVGVPPPPSGVAGTGGDRYIDVSWHALPGRYTATASPGGATCRSSRTDHCRIGGLSDGTAYTVTVTVSTIDGTSLPSAPSAPVTPQSAPARPLGVQADPGDGSLTVSWTASASLGSGTFTGYTAVASPGGAGCTTSGTTCAISGLANGTTYTVTVVALTSAGRSPAGGPSNPVTPGSPDLPARLPGGDTLASSSGDALTVPQLSTVLSGAGFAPGTPVLVAVYPVPRRLVLASSDAAGDVQISIRVPDELRGGYTLVARGYAAGGGTRTLALPITVGVPSMAGGGWVLTALAIFGVLLFVGGLAALVRLCLLRER